MSQSLLGVQALSAAAQDAQVTRWAAMEDEAKLGKVLAGHNAEVTPRVKDVQTTRQVLAIQNVRPPQSAALIIDKCGRRRTLGTKAIWVCGFAFWHAGCVLDHIVEKGACALACGRNT